MKFPIVIHKDPGSSYGVTVPDLPGCFSAGETLDDAIAASYEAICSHIEVLLEDGEAIPIQKPLEVHQADEYLTDGLWALVDVDVSKISGHVVNINVSIPASILARIDAAAKRRGKSRSAFLTFAALHYLNAEFDTELNLT